MQHVDKQLTNLQKQMQKEIEKKVMQIIVLRGFAQIPVYCKGVVLMKMKNAFVPVKRVYSVKPWTHMQEFQLSQEGVGEVSEQACEWSKRVKLAEQSMRCGASERSEQTNVANHRVAH